jgi:hypothetical protein
VSCFFYPIYGKLIKDPAKAGRLISQNHKLEVLSQYDEISGRHTGQRFSGQHAPGIESAAD